MRGYSSFILHSPLRLRGFTLAESLLASVVLAIAVVGICGATSASFQQSQALQQRMTAAALGDQLIEEISAKPYLDPTTQQTTQGNASTNRQSYDNIGDYGGYSDTTAALRDLQGQTVSLGTELYRRAVRVEYRTSFNGSPATTGDFAVVTVTITQPSGQTLIFSRLFTRANVAR